MSIALHIKNDLRRRIRSGGPLPGKFTLESVADLYRVSVTPVRVAVNELVAEGVLHKGENRRLIPAASDSVQDCGLASTTVVPVFPPSLHDVLSRDLVRLSLEGREVQLREEATAEKYGVGRSIIRDVFHQLAGAGLIKHHPRRGWILRPFNEDDMRAFIEIRVALELKALGLARKKLQRADLRRMLDGNRLPETPDGWPVIDNTFHRYIVDKAENFYIADFFDRQGRYYDILFDWEDEDRDTAIETVRQHREILESLLSRDWARARTSLAHHIRCNHPMLSKVVARQEPARKDNGRITENGH